MVYYHHYEYQNVSNYTNSNKKLYFYKTKEKE